MLRQKPTLETDNNPDLRTYRGRGDLQLNWSHGMQTASLLYRSTLKGLQHGAVHFEWTCPI